MKNIKVKLAAYKIPDGFAVSDGHTTKRGKNVVAFHVDAYTKTGRIFGSCTCTSITVFGTDGSIKNVSYPSISVADGSDDCDFVDMYFPEYEGWEVHSFGGGKTISVCLTRRRK